MLHDGKKYAPLFLALALLAFSPCSAIAEEAGEVVEVEVDMSEVSGAIDDLATAQEETNGQIDELATVLDELAVGADEDSATSKEILEELQGIRQDGQAAEIPTELMDSVSRIDTNLDKLANQEEEEQEEEQPEPYIDLEGLAQLVMLDVICNAMSLGVSMFSKFWHVLAGGGR